MHGTRMLLIRKILPNTRSQQQTKASLKEDPRSKANPKGEREKEGA